MGEGADPARTRKVSALLLVVGLVLFAVVRARLWLDDFGNPDIGGIAYSADLIRSGGLPYVDTVEFKAPGSFFLVAGIFTVFGRSMDGLQLGYTIWLLAGAPAIWLAAGASREAEPDARGPALAVAVYLLYAGMFDLNYSSWMMPAYAWAWCATVRGLTAGGTGRSLAWSLGAGLLGVLAFSLKRQAVVLGVAMLVAWAVAMRSGRPGARLWTPAWWILGGLLGLSLVALPYAAKGETAALFEGLFAVGKVSAYAEVGGGGVRSSTLVGKVALQLLTTFPVALALAAVGLWGAARARSRPDGDESGPALVPQLALVAASVAAGGLGGARFFLHYLAQDIPGLALLAGRRESVDLLASAWRPVERQRARLASAAAWLLVLIVGAGQGWQIASGNGHRYDAMPRRLESGKTAAQAAGAHIRSRTGPEDTIFVWGWTAWRVPFWAERRNATRVYKPLGTLTEFNTNGTFFEARPIHFRPGPYADEVLAAFRTAPPAYIVHSNSYTTTFMCDRDPLLEFEALAELIRTEYTPEAQYGDLFLYVRRDRLAPPGPLTTTATE